MNVNKQKLFWIYRKIKIVKPQHFLILSLIFLGLGIHGVRQNSLETSRLKNLVLKADEKNGDIETALRDLRVHVYSHMNTSLSSGNSSIKPPIQLKNRYDKLVGEESKKVAKQNAIIKQEAEKICAQKFAGNGVNSDRVNCIASYLNNHAVTVSSVPTELYMFDFISPKWTPDFAGTSLVFSIIFLLAFMARFSAGIWYKNKN